VVAAGRQLVELTPGIRAESRVLGSIFRIQTAAVLSECMRHWSALAPLHRCLTGNIQAT
jgi:hypothetical protein